jgi:hypothetical protein
MSECKNCSPEASKLIMVDDMTSKEPKCVDCGRVIKPYTPSPGQTVERYIPPPRTISFHDPKGEIIGKFYWDDKEFKFEGEMEESARKFVDYLLKLFEKEIQAAKLEEREKIVSRVEVYLSGSARLHGVSFEEFLRLEDMVSKMHQPAQGEGKEGGE